MAILIATFKVRFPEFDPGDASNDALIQAMLDDAEARINSTLFGALEDSAHGWLTAHLLTVHPYGINARAVDDKTEDPYLKQWKILARSVGMGFRVVGSVEGLVIDPDAF